MRVLDPNMRIFVDTLVSVFTDQSAFGALQCHKNNLRRKKLSKRSISVKRCQECIDHPKHRAFSESSHHIEFGS
jgi:hypothetical protein